MIEEYSFNNSPMAQLIVNPFADSIDKVNPVAARLFWTSQNELTGQRFSRFFAQSFIHLMSFTQAVLELGQSWSADLSIVDPTSQSTRELEMSAGKIGEGSRIKLHFYIHDIQEIDRKRAVSTAHKRYLSGLSHWKRVERFFEEVERDNQLILNAAGEGIYGVDAKGCTTFVNPVAEQLLGWTADELAGKEIHKIIHHTHQHGHDYPKINCPIYAAFRDGAVHRVTDEIFWRKDGNSIPVEYTSTPIRDNGYLIGAVVVFRDVTNQKKAEKSLLAALEEVEVLKHKLEQENAYLQEEILVEHNHHEIVGSSSAIKNVIQQIELVGPTDASVLITGESGTGKELVARAIHKASNRSGRPLIRVNCAAIPREVFESEFFGHVRGAFTGAVADRLGRFELADGGTIFLDEIGELPYELQGKLLRVLQEQQFERIGDSATRSVDVRVIAATNQDLQTRVKEGLFREDLYFRLNVFPVELPSLRSRRDDIPNLAMHFIEKTKQQFNRPNLQISIAQMNQLADYSWPGNIRELQNVIERQVIVATNNHLVFDGLVPNDHAPLPNNRTENVEVLMTEPQKVDHDRARIIAALKQANGKVSGQNGAASILQVKPTTLSSRIKRHRIDIAKYKGP